MVILKFAVCFAWFVVICVFLGSLYIFRVSLGSFAGSGCSWVFLKVSVGI